MTEDIIETIVLFIGACWLVRKWYKKKIIGPLFAGMILLLMIPSRWPFFLPMKISFALWAFCAVAFLFFERHRKKNREEQSTAILYIMLFLAFGLAFLSEGLYSMYKR